jgi:hypothetical protein
MSRFEQGSERPEATGSGNAPEGDGMDYATRLAELLHDLGQTIGLPDLRPDESGYVCLVMEEAHALQLQLNPHTGELTVFSSLGRLGSEHRATVNDHLLSANLFWQGTAGATIGVDPADHEVIIARQLLVDRLESQAFVAAIDDFAKLCDAWRSYLADLDQLLGQSDQPKALPLPSTTSIWG